MQSFDQLGLSQDITLALSELGYSTPTPVQAQAIPQILQSTQDLKAFAQTGTGKTAAFSLPIIEQIDIFNKHTQAIILSPTRELAIQIAKNIIAFSKHLPHVNVATVYGGANIVDQIRQLQRGAQIVVGTPGRMLDLVKRRKLKPEQLQWLVLDEADEMLNMGFKEELDQILEHTPESKQTLLFSATFPKEVERIASNYMHDPKEIAVGTKNAGSTQVSHEYYLVGDRERYLALKRILDINPTIYGIVFCRTRRETKDVAEKLMNDGYNADALHGDLTQAQRDVVMQKFRSKYLQILVATDVAARGLDVNDLTHVINYQVPDQPETYTHRSGRTGRAGKKGVSMLLIAPKERHKLRPVEKKIQKKFEVKSIPNGKAICKAQLYHLIDKVHDIEVNEKEINDFLPDIYKKFEGLDREELIQRFVSLEFNQFLSYYENALDLNETAHKKKKDHIKFSRIFISLGKKDKLNPGKLIGLINDHLSAKNVEIGQIELLKNFSFFELDKQHTEELVSKMHRSEYNGRSLIVEEAQEKKGGRKKRRNFKPERNKQRSNQGKSINAGRPGRRKRFK